MTFVHVAHARVLGGVPQMTKTDSYKTASWIDTGGKDPSHISRRKHYRLVLGSVGYDIRFLRGTEELLYAGYDVLTG